MSRNKNIIHSCCLKLSRVMHILSHTSLNIGSTVSLNPSPLSLATLQIYRLVERGGKYVYCCSHSNMVHILGAPQAWALHGTSFGTAVCIKWIRFYPQLKESISTFLYRKPLVGWNAVLLKCIAHHLYTLKCHPSMLFETYLIKWLQHTS